MPTRTLYRHWCQTCKNWELFDDISKFSDKELNLVCRECDTPFVKTLLKDIPKDKLLEQRERYNAKRRESYKRMYDEFTMDPQSRNILEMVNMFKEPGWDTEIEEADAGQKAIDETARLKRQEEIEKKEQRKQEVIEECIPYKNLRRNDKCICKSGKKYKQCCMDKIEGYLIEYHLRF